MTIARPALPSNNDDPLPMTPPSRTSGLRRSLCYTLFGLASTLDDALDVLFTQLAETTLRSHAQTFYLTHIIDRRWTDNPDVYTQVEVGGKRYRIPEPNRIKLHERFNALGIHTENKPACTYDHA